MEFTTSTAEALRTPDQPERRKPRRRWVLALFSLPFVAGAIGMFAFMLAPTLWDAMRMQSWHEGTAHLTGAGAEPIRGDDSVSYKARATYTYEYGGREYHGDRPAIDRTADNIGDFQQRLGNSLRRHWENGQAVPVWIDPDEPTQSVLNRDLRWGKVGLLMAVALAFGGAGLVMLWLGLGKRSAATSAESPDEPWLSNPEWAKREIGSGAKPTLVLAWILAVIWNLIAVPAAAMSVRAFLDNGGQDLRLLIALVFPVAGIGLLVWALRETLGWRRFGPTTFVMDPHPGAIDGQVGGTLDVRVPYDANLEFRVSLNCVHSRITGSGKNRQRRESVVWQTHGYAHAAPGVEGTRLEVLFDVDSGLPASEPQDHRDYHLWRLQVEAELPGTDFDRSYVIPVFPTAEPSRVLRRLCTEHRAAAEERKREIDSVLDIQRIPGGFELYYPAFRKPAAKLVGLLIGAIFIGVYVFTAGTETPLPFRLLFGGVGGLLLVGSLYFLCVSLRVRIDAAGLETRKWLLGLPAGGKTVSREEISGLTFKQSYTQSGGKKHTVYFKLQALIGSGEAVTIGYNLAGRETAREALDALSELTGIPVAGALEQNVLA